jgi:hypothetical protein
MKSLKPFFYVTDIGFLVYWLITALGRVPAEWAFNGYHDPVLVAWNWSFLPLDLLISATGLTALWVARSGRLDWRGLAIASLALTSASGLNAIAFWALRGEVDWQWWLPNLYLLLYPWAFLPGLLRPSPLDATRSARP